MPQWKITRIIEEMGADEKGMPRSYIRVEFMVGEDGPFTHRAPRKDFYTELIRQHLDEFAHHLAALRS